jgi:hypothetical protein
MHLLSDRFANHDFAGADLALQQPLDPEAPRAFEKMQRELRFLAKRQYWAKMKKHQPRPSGSDSDTDE